MTGSLSIKSAANTHNRSLVHSKKTPECFCGGSTAQVFFSELKEARRAEPSVLEWQAGKLIFGESTLAGDRTPCVFGAAPAGQSRNCSNDGFQKREIRFIGLR